MAIAGPRLAMRTPRFPLISVDVTFCLRIEFARRSDIVIEKDPFVSGAASMYRVSREILELSRSRLGVARYDSATRLATTFSYDPVPGRCCRLEPSLHAVKLLLPDVVPQNLTP